ncbi:MAG TPA: PDZ domain-containing protein [Steroidobacteraceae bacterium]|nr:PDZ domain-containing protein [Steroidobacteraceae bacterium]
MIKIRMFLLAAALMSANALAADVAPAAGAAGSGPGADLDAQLAAARQKLEAAARDVAQLSAQLGQSAMARVQSLRTRAVLGIQLQVEPSAKEQGATVIGVSPGGPAADAGVATGDVIVALDGAPVTGPDAGRQVVERMALVKPDSKVTLKVLRDGKPKEFQITPRANVVDFFPGFAGPGRPGGFSPPWQPAGIRPAGVGPMFEGMELADLSPALGQYFGTSQGVLVIRVPRGADFLKLQDGDVILSIDGRVPENGSHATRILRSYQPGEKIHLKVMRQKKTLELEGSLPARHHPEPPPGPDGGPDDRPPPPR